MELHSRQKVKILWVFFDCRSVAGVSQFTPGYKLMSIRVLNLYKTSVQTSQTRVHGRIPALNLCKPNDSRSLFNLGDCVSFEWKRARRVTDAIVTGCDRDNVVTT